MSTRKVHGKRSSTGNHPLLPAMRPMTASFIPKVPTYTFLKWTFGRGSVIWKIWPAVLLHTLFAAAVVYTWGFTGRMLEIPNVMLTVMGVVIGFVISYRAISGYDRYWMGRTAWSDVIRNARTMGRLIWYHVPPRLTPGPMPQMASASTGTGNVNANAPTTQELAKVMVEKRMALDLVEAFAVALKHHLRGELGIYYEDLYDLIRPLHDFTNPANPHPTVASALPSPAPVASSSLAPPAASSSGVFTSSSSSNGTLKTTTHAAKRPTADATSTPTSASGANLKRPAASHVASASTTSLHRPLLPASNPSPEEGVLRRVSPDVIPFAGVFAGVGGWLKGLRGAHKEDLDGHRKRDRSSRMRAWSGPIHPQGLAQPGEYEKGENLPEEVLRCLSEWISVLEARATVPGASLGAILGGIQSFEMSLTTLEHILTTPLPFVYSVHIRHVVWLYLFLLPLQLVSDFQWHTVPAVSVGAFVYLGFVAAGEEIEQPFGYDDNDLDLDMFCRDIIRQDIQCLKKTPCLNAWFPPKPSVLGPASSSSSTSAQNQNQSAATAINTNGNGNTGGDASLLSPELNVPYAHTEAGSTQIAHAYGGNIYRTSLASLSDTVSLEDVTEEDEEEEITETETETEAEGEEGTEENVVREGELVDVR
ncbi:Bestrophin, RFP-TM, chloride channel-domain-containing protein [Mycena vulgaris]|nr:Bestrophin, RFP-TM, chloride channel-domain-containing protein [Mycena vulgaris]